MADDDNPIGHWNDGPEPEERGDDERAGTEGPTDTAGESTTVDQPDPGDDERAGTETSPSGQTTGAPAAPAAPETTLTGPVQVADFSNDEPEVIEGNPHAFDVPPFPSLIPPPVPPEGPQMYATTPEENEQGDAAQQQAEKTQEWINQSTEIRHEPSPFEPKPEEGPYEPPPIEMVIP